MEAGVVDNFQSDTAAEISAETGVDAESSEIFNYTHESGLIVSATVQEMGACAVMSLVSPDSRAEIARAAMIGRQIQAEEDKANESKETEPKEETESEGDKTEKAEVSAAGKGSDGALRDKQVTPRQQTAKLEPLQSFDAPKQELVAEDNALAKADVTNNKTVQSGNKPDADAGTPNPDANNTPSTEKASVESTPEVQTTTVSASVEASSISGDSGYSVESKTPEPVRAATTEASVVAAIPAEADTQPKAAEGLSEPDITTILTLETDGLDLEPEENLRIDEQYLDLDPETGAGWDYAETEIETEATQDDLELDPFLPADEQPLYLEESVEYEIPRIAEDYEFIIPIETPAFDMTEFPSAPPELTAELSAPLEEVEESITLVMDAIEGLEAEESETVHEILDDIVQIIAEVQTPAEDDTQNLEAAAETTDAKEELKMLFIELFDYLEIDYSMELVESFVKLALQGDMSDLIEAVKQDEKNNFAQNRGTHEVIKQLLATISNIKKSVQHAYQIGKSALQLYSQESLLLDLKRRPAYETADY